MFFIRHIQSAKRLIFPLIALPIILAAIFMPSAALASTYGSGSYGNCKYSTGCPAAPASGGSGSTGNTVTTTSGLQILLNDFGDYMTTGVQLELNPGQSVYFNITQSDGSNQQYTISVKQVGTDYAVFTITGISGDIKLMVGETKQFDVDGDGKPDIEITLDSIKDGKAVMTFKGLVKGASTTVTTPTTTDAKKSSWQIWLWLGLILAGLVIFIILLAKRRKKHN